MAAKDMRRMRNAASLSGRILLSMFKPGSAELSLLDEASKSGSLDYAEGREGRGA